MSEGPERRPAACESTEFAGRREEPCGFHLASLEVALERHIGPPGVRALHQLTTRERRGGGREGRQLSEVLVQRQFSESTRKQQVAGRRRGPSAGLREDRHPPPTQRRVVEDIVVHERRRMDQLHGGGGATQCDVRLAAQTGDEHEQRTQALAASFNCRQRIGLNCRDLAQSRLDARHRRAQRLAAELENRIERLGEDLAHTEPSESPPAILGGTSSERSCVPMTSPTCRAMMPPAVRM